MSFGDGESGIDSHPKRTDPPCTRTEISQALLAFGSVRASIRKGGDSKVTSPGKQLPESLLKVEESKNPLAADAGESAVGEGHENSPDTDPSVFVTMVDENTTTTTSSLPFKPNGVVFTLLVDVPVFLLGFVAFLGVRYFRGDKRGKGSSRSRSTHCLYL